MFDSLHQAIDAYQKLYAERTAQEQESKLTKAAERAVMQWILNHMIEGKIDQALGTSWLVEQAKGLNAEFEEEKQFFEFISKHRRSGAFSLLYRRINQDVARTWAETMALPGIKWVPWIKLHHRSISGDFSDTEGFPKMTTMFGGDTR